MLNQPSSTTVSRPEPPGLRGFVEQATLWGAGRQANMQAAETTDGDAGRSRTSGLDDGGDAR